MLTRLLVALLRGYRFAVSPLYGETCRYYPSCSAYALEAVSVHGAGRGSWLALRRLARCHPWTPGGVDLVPPREGTAHPHPSVVPPDEPAPDEPAPDEPAPDEPAADQPAADQPAADQPAADQPAKA